MEETKITICTVNYNSSEFIENMLYALKKLTLDSYKVIIRDNNSKLSDFNNLIRIIKENNYENVELYRVDTELVGSIAHGEALNELVSKVKTKYGVILDADAVFLTKGWDNILIGCLNESQPVIGTQADISSGKPEDFPLMFAIMFENQVLKKMNIDFRPKDIGKFQDTGWELRDKYLSSGFKGGLIYSFSTRQYKNGPFGGVICTEYYMSKTGEGRIFASHFGRGSSPIGKKLVSIGSSHSIFFRVVNKLLKYANVIKWHLDRKKWLSICRDIINEEKNAK